MPPTSPSRSRPAAPRKIRKVRKETGDRRLKRIAEQLVAATRDGDAGARKYVTLYNAFLDAIESGLWKPGERLPSEAVIAEILPVSLGTVQRALQALVDQGVVRRRHGQGSFVAGLPIDANQIRNFRFLDDGGERLLPVYGRVLKVDATDEAGPWSRFLAPEKKFVRITRLISVNLEFQTFSEVYLPKGKFGDFLTMPPASISVPLTHMLSERFNAPTLHVTHTVSCEELPEKAYLAIAQAPASMGLVWEIFSHTYRKAPSFYQRVYLPLTNRRLQFPDMG